MIPYLGWKPFYNTEKYRIFIYRVEIPAIDPNINHYKGNLEKDGCIVFCEDSAIVHDNALYDFAMEIPIVSGGYDFKKIQKDFHFKEEPRITDRNQFITTFSDGKSKIEIANTVVFQKYTCPPTINAYAVETKEVLFIYDDDILYDAIKEGIQNTRGIKPKDGGLYQLSIEQLKIIDKSVRTATLYEQQEKDGRLCFFASFDSRLI